jgi:hypothetical protein
MKQINEQTKKKRLKKVFTNKDQVLHLWANQSQSEARCSNVFFSGTSCYSYGFHYELGRLVQYNGETVALINDEIYSNTTAKHQHAAFQAVEHLPRLRTTYFEDVRLALLENQDKLINELMKHFSANTFRTYQLEHYGNNKFGYWLTKQINEFNQTCITLKHPELMIEPDEHFEEVWLEHVHLRLKRAEELNSAKRELLNQRKEQLKLEKLQEQINTWRTDGGSLPYEVRRELRFHLLRVQDGVVKTSGGAEVPLNQALKLLALIERDQAKQGEQVGSFRLNHVRDGVVTVGCHKIQLSEAKQVLGPYKGQELRLVTENSEQGANQ